MFYLKEVRPHFKLYVSPINIDPATPALPITTRRPTPRSSAEKFGPFFTKGLPADTSALDNDVLDEEEFLDQDDMVLEESRAMLDYELDRFDSGLLFYYISSTDQRQHMFWRLIDEKHPAYDRVLAAKFGGTIETDLPRGRRDPGPVHGPGRQGHGRPGHVRPRLQSLLPRLQPEHLAPRERLSPADQRIQDGRPGDVAFAGTDWARRPRPTASG